MGIRSLLPLNHLRNGITRLSYKLMHSVGLSSHCWDIFQLGKFLNTMEIYTKLLFYLICVKLNWGTDNFMSKLPGPKAWCSTIQEQNHCHSVDINQQASLSTHLLDTCHMLDTLPTMCYILDKNKNKKKCQSWRFLPVTRSPTSPFRTKQIPQSFPRSTLTSWWRG